MLREIVFHFLKAIYDTSFRLFFGELNCPVIRRPTIANPGLKFSSGSSVVQTHFLGYLSLCFVKHPMNKLWSKTIKLILLSEVSAFISKL